MSKLIAVLSLAFVLPLVGLSGVAEAQYPPPVGNVVASAATTIAAVGDNVPITGTITTSSGAPVPGVMVIFSVESEPGSTAEIGSKVTTKITDTAGKAVAILRTGETPGIVSIAITSPNGLMSRVLVTVSGSLTPGFPSVPPFAPVQYPPIYSYPAPTPLYASPTTLFSSPASAQVAVSAPAAPSDAASAPGLPPAAPIEPVGPLSSIRPPSTGDAGLASKHGESYGIALMLVGVVGAIAIAGLAGTASDLCRTDG